MVVVTDAVAADYLDSIQKEKMGSFVCYSYAVVVDSNPAMSHGDDSGGILGIARCCCC